MTQRDRKRLLWLINAVLIVALPAALVASLWPMGVSLPSAPVGADQGAATRPAGKRIAPLSFYAAIYRRELRKPLFDKPSGPKPAPSAPKLTARLTGTVVEPGYSFAILRTPAGEIIMVGIGELVEGAEVVEIHARSVKLKHRETFVTLKVPEQGDKR